MAAEPPHNRQPRKRRNARDLTVIGIGIVFLLLSAYSLVGNTQAGSVQPVYYDSAEPTSSQLQNPQSWAEKYVPPISLFAVGAFCVLLGVIDVRD